MSDTAFVLLIVAAGLVGLACAVLALAVLIDTAWERARRRRLARRGMTDRQVANALDPGEYGVDISVWPSRAPRNGSTGSAEDYVG